MTRTGVLEGRRSLLATGHVGEGIAGVPGENSCFQTALIPATIVSIHTTLKTIGLSLISFSSRCKSSAIVRPSKFDLQLTSAFWSRAATARFVSSNTLFRSSKSKGLTM